MADQSKSTEPRTCCGAQPQAWMPKRGEPQALACILCRASGRHWEASGPSQSRPLGE